jgi:hypothetical protein
MSKENRDRVVRQQFTPRLWLDRGVFHAEVGHPGCEKPLRVILHGVSSFEQAHTAIALLNRRGSGFMQAGSPR